MFRCCALGHTDQLTDVDGQHRANLTCCSLLRRAFCGANVLGLMLLPHTSNSSSATFIFIFTHSFSPTSHQTQRLSCLGHVFFRGNRGICKVRRVSAIVPRILAFCHITPQIWLILSVNITKSAILGLQYEKIYLCALKSRRHGQLSLAHGTEIKNKEKLKTKTE